MTTRTPYQCEAGDRFVLAVMLLFGVLLTIAQAYVFMQGKSNVVIGVMAAGILGGWAFIHSNGETIV